jgi:hypothetical protein
MGEMVASDVDNLGPFRQRPNCKSHRERAAHCGYEL